MADNKKYYYLKIKENFYETEDMKILQAMDNGYLYSDILMKLYLKSLKTDGKLMFKENIPYSPKMIATITNHNVDTVDKALCIFRELGLIEVLDNGAIYMLDIQSLIGKSSSEADRKRDYRNRIKEEKKLLLGEVDKCPDTSGTNSDKHSREIEIETEIELEKEIENKKDICRQLSSTWTNNGYGTLNKTLLDKLLADVELYSIEWVIKAMEIGNKRSKRNYSYFKGILENWKTEGYKEVEHGSTRQDIKPGENKWSKYEFE